MGRLFPEMRQLIRAIEHDFPITPLTRFGRHQPPPSIFIHPVSDVHETSKSYVIETELPGARKEGLSMEIDDDHTLVIHGRIKRQGEKDNGKSDAPVLWSGERVIGEFRRVFTLPNKIDPDKLKATLKNGLLTVEIPKTEHSSAKVNVEIKEE